MPLPSPPRARLRGATRWRPWPPPPPPRARSCLVPPRGRRISSQPMCPCAAPIAKGFGSPNTVDRRLRPGGCDFLPCPSRNWPCARSWPYCPNEGRRFVCILGAAKAKARGVMMTVMKMVIELAPDAWIPGGKPDPMIHQQHGHIGQPIPRLDGLLKVRGTARFAADMAMPNLTYARRCRRIAVRRACHDRCRLSARRRAIHDA